MDTNVLVYAFDGGERAKRDRATAVLADIGRDAVLSSQVLNEFYWVTTRKLAVPLSHADAAAAVERLCRLDVVPVDAALTRDAIALAESAHLALWDSLVVRAAAVAGCGRLLSEDLADGRVISGVAIENPFRDLTDDA